jgi:hypothetical protein
MVIPCSFVVELPITKPPTRISHQPCEPCCLTIAAPHWPTITSHLLNEGIYPIIPCYGKQGIRSTNLKSLLQCCIPPFIPTSCSDPRSIQQSWARKYQPYLPHSIPSNVDVSLSALRSAYHRVLKNHFSACFLGDRNKEEVGATSNPGKVALKCLQNPPFFHHCTSKIRMYENWA